MLTPMTRAGGLPANLELRMADAGWLVARHVPFPLAHGRGHLGIFRHYEGSRARANTVAISAILWHYRRNPAFQGGSDA